MLSPTATQTTGRCWKPVSIGIINAKKRIRFMSDPKLPEMMIQVFVKMLAPLLRRQLSKEMVWFVGERRPFFVNVPQIPDHLCPFAVEGELSGDFEWLRGRTAFRKRFVTI